MVNRRHLGIFTLLLGGILLFTTPAFAEAGSGEVSIEVLPSLTLTLSGDSLSISNLAAETLTNSNSLSATVATNNQTGYTLSATAGTIDNSTTNLTNTNSSTYFSTLASGGFTASAFADDSWGISTDNGSTYYGLPLYSAEPLSINSSDGPATATTSFLIGAKASSNMTSGDYFNIITLTAVTNFIPDTRTLADITEMQEITPEICANTSTPAASDGASTPQYKLTDSRDNKTYWVAKLADGKCWMTQNLDLDLSTEITLTPSDSNVAFNWTPERSTIGSSWELSSSHPYSKNAGNIYIKGSTYYYSLTSCVNAGNAQSDCEHWHVGNYYNWTAAVASNDSSDLSTRVAQDYSSRYNAPDSICPKGWRLPNTFDDDAVTNGDFKGLDTAYGSTANFSFIDSPLWLTLSGGAYSMGTVNNDGTYGFYWSSTTYNGGSDYGYYFVFGNRINNHIDSGTKIFGYPIRCVSGGI